MIERYLRLKLLEFHVVHHCNLTCANCSHFSPNAPTWFADVEEYQKELLLSVQYILPEFVHILGGEPLLHPSLDKIIAITRNTFNKSTIKIVTNGILFSNIPKTLLMAMAAHNISLAVSVYPQVKINKTNIVNLCSEYGISNEFWHQETFLDFFNSEGDSNPILARASCPMEGANTIRNGRLYPCPITAWADFSGVHLTESDGVALNSDEDLNSVLDLNRITSRCRFCRANPPRVLHQLIAGSKRKYKQ